MLDLDAGKDALFVWGSYAALALAFGWMITDTLLRARKWRRRAEELQAARDEAKGQGRAKS